MTDIATEIGTIGIEIEMVIITGTPAVTVTTRRTIGTVTEEEGAETKVLRHRPALGMVTTPTPEEEEEEGGVADGTNMTGTGGIEIGTTTGEIGTGMDIVAGGGVLIVTDTTPHLVTSTTLRVTTRKVGGATVTMATTGMIEEEDMVAIVVGVATGGDSGGTLNQEVC